MARNKYRKAKAAIIWWAYLLFGVFFLLVALPAMISAPDTLTNFLGMWLLMLYGVWSYFLWVKPLYRKVIGEL